MPNLRSFVAGATLASGLLAQTPCYDTNIGAGLSIGDDQVVQGLSLGFTFTYNAVGYTQICIDSNGSIYLGGATTALSDYTPTVLDFDNSVQPRICGLWTDFNAAAAGDVHFNAIPAAGPNPAKALITWNQVVEFGRTAPLLDVQVTLDANNGVTVSYGSTAPICGTLNTSMIIGATPGLGAASTLVSLATRPLPVASNAFADVRSAVNGPAGFTMSWLPTLPGYLVIDAPCVPPAFSQVVGGGCPRRNLPTVYELFSNPTNPVDVSGMNFTFLPNGQNGYIVVPGIAGPMFTGFTNNLGAGDDTSHAVSLPFGVPHAGISETNIYVSSNGFITFGATNPGADCCAGSSAVLRGDPQSRLAAWWSDLNPVAGGGVFADLDTATNEFCVTWNNVPEFGQAGTSNTCQIAMDATGILKVRLASVQNVSHTYLLGYSYGNGAPEPGATDFSAIVSHDTGPLALGQPLTQAAQPGSRPQMGTTFNVDTTNVPAAPQGNVVGMIIMFTEIPPTPLDFIGATGCTAYGDPTAPEVLMTFQLAFGAPLVTTGTAIPVLPAILSLNVMSQTFSDDATANPFGWVISNGLRWTITAF